MRLALRGVLALIAIISMLLGSSAFAGDSFISSVDLSASVLGQVDIGGSATLSADFQVRDAVAAPSSLGDMNNDGSCNHDDVGPFELALCDSAAYLAQHNVPDYAERGDFNGDGTFDNFDISGLQTALDNPIPEPGTAMLAGLALGGLLFFGRRRRQKA